jgi:uracil-DNA glycosylase
MDIWRSNKMTGSLGNFAFDAPVRALDQEDRSPKQIFVLGVYASAVHARWKYSGHEVVKALAVASEPCIFWNGERAEEIIRQVAIPPEWGSLEPADPRFNGPSGRALDECFLAPLGLKRKDAWLCDLVPHSCLNLQQEKAIQRVRKLYPHFQFSEPTVPKLPDPPVTDERRAQILQELSESRASILVLLGDEPIRWFLHPVAGGWKRLADFGTTNKEYGKLHPANIVGREWKVLPLAHPRQVARLGRSSTRWYDLHQWWIEHRAAMLLGDG